MYNLSEVEIFLGGGGRVFYRTIHAAGMKERKGEWIRGRKIFRPYGKSGVWIHFLPIDSFSTDRFRPNGLKEM